MSAFRIFLSTVCCLLLAMLARRPPLSSPRLKVHELAMFLVSNAVHHHHHHDHHNHHDNHHHHYRHNPYHHTTLARAPVSSAVTKRVPVVQPLSLETVLHHLFPAVNVGRASGERKYLTLPQPPPLSVCCRLWSPAMSVQVSVFLRDPTVLFDRYTHAHTYTHTYTCTKSHTHAHTHTHAFTHTHTHTLTHTHTGRACWPYLETISVTLEDHNRDSLTP
jgi:hypothetical protein